MTCHAFANAATHPVMGSCGMQLHCSWTHLIVSTRLRKLQAQLMVKAISRFSGAHSQQD